MSGYGISESQLTDLLRSIDGPSAMTKDEADQVLDQVYRQAGFRRSDAGRPMRVRSSTSPEIHHELMLIDRPTPVEAPAPPMIEAVDLVTRDGRTVARYAPTDGQGRRRSLGRRLLLTAAVIAVLGAPFGVFRYTLDRPARAVFDLQSTDRPDVPHTTSEPDLNGQRRAGDEERSSYPYVVPQPPAGYVPELLVATGADLVKVGADNGAGVSDRLEAGQNVVRAFDDLGAGVVVERIGADGRRTISWLDGAAERPVLSDAILHDVGYAGSPYAVVETGDVDRAAGRHRRLEWIGLADLERTPLLALGEGQEILSASASGGLIAVALGNGECGELRFVTTDGDELSIETDNGECSAPDHADVTNVALSPEGDAVAYTTVTYRPDGQEAGTELNVLDLATGNVYFRRRIGESGHGITSLTYDGDRVAYVLQSPDGETVAAVARASAGPREGPLQAPPEIEHIRGIDQLSGVSFARVPINW